mgnify:CR=1 FL=1
MKKQLVLFLALMTVFYSASNAQAGFLIEPFAGIEMGSTSEDNNGDSGDMTGNTMGARVGWQNAGLMAGLDYRMMNWTIEGDPDDSDASFTQMGLFVGYDFPMMLRLWGTYVFSMEGEDDDSGNEITDGSGLNLGIGYKVMPFVSLNLEIGSTKTTKLKSGSNEIDFDLKYNSYLFSVSFPISI